MTETRDLMWSNTAEFTELILWRHVKTIYRNVSENLQFDHHVKYAL